VTVTAHREQSVVTLSVQDTGMGIPTEHLPHIFERFRQVDGSMTRAQGGLGLGLAIVRHLVEAHGGTVTVRSDGPNFGTSFTVILPIRSVEMTEAQVEAETEKARTIEKERTTGVRFVAPGRAPLRNLRILVVDDDVDSLELIRVVIEGAGAAFRGVTSARQALDATKHHRFDVIISDIGMPEMDGFALIRRIRSLPSGAADVPAIALTAYARAEDADLALKAGYQQHLAKPVAAHELLAAVQKLLCEPG
jgi:CheY-like chemotaxis protein